MKCPKCGSEDISEVGNSSLDIVAKCGACGYEDFIKKFLAEESKDDSN